MASRSSLWPDPHRKPPWGAAELDRSHPLARNLAIHWAMNGGAMVADAVGAEHGVLSGATRPGWRASSEGLALQFDGTSSYLVNQTVLNTARLTLAFQFRVLTLPGLTDKKICGFTDGNGSSTFDKVFAIGRTTSNVVEWYVFDGAAKFLADTAGALVANNTYTFVGTANGTTSRIYRDGVERNSIAAGATFTGYTVPNIIAGGNTAGAPALGYLAQMIDWMAVWTEALPAESVQWLTTEPYAMYRPIIRRRYIMPAVGLTLSPAGSVITITGIIPVPSMGILLTPMTA